VDAGSPPERPSFAAHGRVHGYRAPGCFLKGVEVETLLKILWTMFVVLGLLAVSLYFTTPSCMTKKQRGFEVATVICLILSVLSFVTAVILGIWGVQL